MTERIRLVRGDTLPQIVFSLKDEQSAVPINMVGATPRLKFRMVGSSTLAATLVGSVLPGLELEDGSISYTDPYNVPGRGGRCMFQWGSSDLSGPPGRYEGEIEITFPGGAVQTVYDRVKFSVREQF